MKKLQAIILSYLLVASSLITLMPQEAQAETVSKQEETASNQEKSEGVWVSTWNDYTYDSKYKIGDSWATGWKQIDGKWYYFYSDGIQARATPESSWIQIDGKWYYFYPSGDMMTNCTKDGYRAGKDGVCVAI